MARSDSGISGMAAPSDERYVATDDETFSLTSSVFNYHYENGRRYHGFREGTYYAPNDEYQNNQLDIYHHIYLMILGGNLFIAPLESPRRILDIGTGTGIWVIDMADKFPNAEVIGTGDDPGTLRTAVVMANITNRGVPPNVRFEIDDAESPWAYGEKNFDFIHIRCLFGAISDWPALLEQVYKHLAPGGWIEVVEMKLPYECEDGTLPADSYLHKWVQYSIDAGEEMGKPFDVADRMWGWLQNAGFRDMEEKSFNVPLGPWSNDPFLRDLGRYNLLNILEGMDGFTTALFTRYLGWNRTEVQAFYGNLRQEVTNPRIHSLFKQCYWIGRKPMS